MLVVTRLYSNLSLIDDATTDSLFKDFKPFRHASFFLHASNSHYNVIMKIGRITLSFANRDNYVIAFSIIALFYKIGLLKD